MITKIEDIIILQAARAAGFTVRGLRALIATRGSGVRIDAAQITYRGRDVFNEEIATVAEIHVRVKIGNPRERSLDRSVVQIDANIGHPPEDRALHLKYALRVSEDGEIDLTPLELSQPGDGDERPKQWF